MKDNELVEQFRDYIQIPSITPSGNEVKAIKYIENILKGASIDYSIEAREEEHPNLIAKLTATRLVKEKPIILISHSDVVPVNEEAWTFPPFSATVSKNRIYGRGTLDTKQLTMMQLYSFLEIAKHKELLNRDVYLCVTANEEGGSFYGMEYMKEIHKDYFEEAIVINEGGGFPIITEEDYYLTMTIGEKGRAEVELIASGLGSHASAPSKDQAILKLMKQLSTLIEGIEALKGADKSPLEILKSKLSSKSLFIDRMLAYHENHDIKVKKKLLGQGGNIIPSKVSLELSIRLLPGISKEAFEEMLTRLIGEKEIDYKIHHFEEGFVNNPTFIKQSMKELETICHRHGQEVSIIPMLALGKTDGRFFGEAGSQVLGFSPLTKEDPFESVLEQVHGNDESIAIESLIYGSHVIKDWLTSQCIGGINDDDTK